MRPMPPADAAQRCPGGGAEGARAAKNRPHRAASRAILSSSGTKALRGELAALLHGDITRLPLPAGDVRVVGASGRVRGGALRVAREHAAVGADAAELNTKN